MPTPEDYFRAARERLQQRRYQPAFGAAQGLGSQVVTIRNITIEYRPDPFVSGAVRIDRLAGNDLGGAMPDIAAFFRNQGFTSVEYSPIDAGGQGAARKRLFDALINRAQHHPQQLPTTFHAAQAEPLPEDFSITLAETRQERRNRLRRNLRQARSNAQRTAGLLEAIREEATIQRRARLMGPSQGYQLPRFRGVAATTIVNAQGELVNLPAVPTIEQTLAGTEQVYSRQIRRAAEAFRTNPGFRPRPPAQLQLEGLSTLQTRIARGVSPSALRTALANPTATYQAIENIDVNRLHRYAASGLLPSGLTLDEMEAVIREAASINPGFRNRPSTAVSVGNRALTNQERYALGSLIGRTVPAGTTMADVAVIVPTGRAATNYALRKLTGGIRQITATAARTALSAVPRLGPIGSAIGGELATVAHFNELARTLGQQHEQFLDTLPGIAQARASARQQALNEALTDLYLYGVPLQGRGALSEGFAGMLQRQTEARNYERRVRELAQRAASTYNPLGPIAYNESPAAYYAYRAGERYIVSEPGVFRAQNALDRAIAGEGYYGVMGTTDLASVFKDLELMASASLTDRQLLIGEALRHLGYLANATAYYRNLGLSVRP